VAAALRRAYGPPPPLGRSDPLDGLIATVLSQNTTSANSRAAFSELTRRFPTWEACLCAEPVAVVDAIRGAGLAQVRGPRIQRVLAQIADGRSGLSLDWLHGAPVPDAMEYLQGLPGIGPKTAACVLLFCCRRAVFPVDTHVARLSGRLGWVCPGTAPEVIQRVLEPAVPPRLRYALHVHLIAHGRAVCHARRPECPRCILRPLCPSSS
jgi:endonuclease-3